MSNTSARIDAKITAILPSWERIAGNWKQFSGSAKERWGKLTDDDLAMIDGRREQLAGKIQEHYGIVKDQAERQVSDWLEAQHRAELAAKKAAGTLGHQ